MSGGTACVLVDADTGARYEVDRGTDAWVASMEWARFHGLDPDEIPAGEEVVRDARNCLIRYKVFVKYGPKRFQIKIVDNEPVMAEMVEQGEGPPLPFPPEVSACVRRD